MSDYDFTGLDFEAETTGSTFGRLVLGAMLLIFAAASMITTFGFFASYAPGLGDVIHPEFGWVIAGVMGVVLFDLAGLGWTVLRARNSDTSKQFVIATAAAVLTITLALLTSGLQVVLSSTFDVGLYLADGSLSAAGQNLQMTGVIVMTLGFVANFAAIAAYINTSRDITAAVQQTQLAAYMTGARFAADQARAEIVTRQTLAAIMAQLPQVARTAGAKNRDAYLDRTGLIVIDQADQPDLDWQPIPTAEQQAEQQREYAQRNREYARRNDRKADQLDPQRPSIGFSLVDLGYADHELDQQAAAHFERVDRADTSPQKTLAHDGQQWVALWVGSSDGRAYTQPVKLPSDPARAWAEVERLGIAPAGMDYATFQQLHSGVNFTKGGK